MKGGREGGREAGRVQGLGLSLADAGVAHRRIDADAQLRGHRHLHQFRGCLVFQAHRLLYH